MVLNYNAEKMRLLPSPVRYITDAKSHYIQGECAEDAVSIELGFFQKKERETFYTFNAQLINNHFEGKLIRVKSRKSDVISTALLSAGIGIIGFLIGFFGSSSLIRIKLGLTIGMLSAIVVALIMLLTFWNERRMMLKLADRFMLKNYNCRRKKKA